DCGICPALKEDLDLFLGPSVPDYVDFVSQYRNESAILKNAENLKICADNKLTEEDKANIQSLLVSSLCVLPKSLYTHLLTPVKGWGVGYSPTLQLLCESRKMSGEGAGRTLAVHLSQARQAPRIPAPMVPLGLHQAFWPSLLNLATSADNTSFSSPNFSSLP
ncbi:Major allergen I polypeptide chain 1, partial [Lemmus lemmus]